MASSQSTVANHVLRADIERCLREGMSCRAVARTYDLSASAVTRYWRAVRKKDEERRARLAEMTDIDKLVERLTNYANIMESMAKAEHGSGKFASAGKLIDTGRKILRDVAELKGLLKPGVQVGVGVNVNSTTTVSAPGKEGPSAEHVKAAIFRVLRRFPEARDALVAEFTRMQIAHDGGAVDGGEAEVVEVEEAPAPRTRRRRRG